MVVTLSEVFMRYVIGRAPMVADEFGGYMMVAIAFLAAAYAWKEKTHVRITAMVNLMPQRAASWLRLITLLLVLGLNIVLVRANYDFVVHSFSVGHRSGTIWRVPLQGPQITIFIGLTLLTLLVALAVAKAIVDIRSGRNIAGEGRQ